MNVSNIKYFCTTNGDGFRTAIFVSGCRLHCKGCFNSKAWDFNFGVELTQELINKILDSIRSEYIDGISILGGEPMDVLNQEGVASIIKAVRDKYGESKDIWLWTGYYKDQIPETKYKKYILDNLNYMIDGPYESDKYDINLKYRGSINQNVIKLK